MIEGRLRVVILVGGPGQFSPTRKLDREKVGLELIEGRLRVYPRAQM